MTVTTPEARVSQAAPIALAPTRSTFAASRAALRALILRDLAVLKKNFAAFVARTVIQPFLLVFVFLMGSQPYYEFGCWPPCSASDASR